jgi:hypothetical protein
MSFRRDKSKTQLWRKWLLQNQDTLNACGLPSLIFQDEAHWWDFLEHGYLDHHEDSSHFKISHLSRAEIQMLRDFLDRELSTEEKRWALVLSQMKTLLSNPPKKNGQDH